MKRSALIILLFCVLLPLFSYSQDFWEPIPYPPTTEPVSNFAMDGNGRLFACNVENVFYTDDMGQNWFSSTNWPGYYARSIAVNSDNTVFIATFNDGVFRSTDGGVSFQECSGGIIADVLVCILVLDNDVLLLGTSEGLYRSVDDGDNWEPFGTGLPVDWIGEISAGDNGKLMAGMQNTGIYRSYDYGNTWEEAGGGLPDTTMVTSILTVPGETAAYAGLFPHGLYFTDNDGDTWTENNDGLPFGTAAMQKDRDYSLHGLTKVQQVIFLYIYAYFVYYSNFTGYPAFPWNPLFGGLPPNADVNAFSALIMTMVICGIMGEGKDGPGIYINAVPVDIEGPGYLSNTYRLVVLPQTDPCHLKCRIRLPEAAAVTLQLHNGLGQEIESISFGTLPEGNHDLEINSGNLQEGFYLLSLTAGNHCLTRKIVCCQ